MKEDLPTNPTPKLTEINDGIRLFQAENGLPFGTDALLLAAFIRPMPYAHAVELGSGTGGISLLCAKHKKLRHIEAVELQPKIAGLLELNVAENDMMHVITPRCADVRTFRPEREADVVFSNPPYMVSSGHRSEAVERQISRHEEFGTLADFCCAAGRMLRFGGVFYAVCRPDRTVDLLCALRQNKLEPKRMISVADSPEMPPCLILTEAKKGAKPSLDKMTNLFLHRNGEISRDYRQLLESGNIS